MKRALVNLALLASGALCVHAFAQQPATNAPAANGADSKQVVALVNGQPITRQFLDGLWERMSPKVRLEYERNGGGKQGFLDNYVLKVLMIQEAKKNGFDQKSAVQAEMEAARESALFDAYVRDVISPTVVTDADVRKFYDDHLTDFTSQQAKLRIIRIGKGEQPERAKERIGQIMTDLLDARTKLAAEGRHVRELKNVFGEIAKAASEDPSANRGGDLGWVERGRLPIGLEEPTFSMPLETVSGIIELKDSFALIYLEERGNRTESYEEVSGMIREYVLGRRKNDVVDAITKTTAALRAHAQIQTFPQNLE